MNILLKTVMITASLMLSTSIFAQEKMADPIAGAQVWADVCMRCHNLREPADLSKRAWK